MPCHYFNFPVHKPGLGIGLVFLAEIVKVFDKGVGKTSVRGIVFAFICRVHYFLLNELVYFLVSKHRIGNDSLCSVLTIFSGRDRVFAVYFYRVVFEGKLISGCCDCC
ncbi:hypothetical protein D3C87_1447220 [compost metagenome]